MTDIDYSLVPLALAGSDWDEAFGAAGDTLRTQILDGRVRGDPYGDMSTKYVDADIRPGRDLTVPLTTFDRTQIERVFSSFDGAHDGPDWRVLGQLRDGRYFYLRAGCDYTGWD